MNDLTEQAPGPPLTPGARVLLGLKTVAIVVVSMCAMAALGIVALIVVISAMSGYFSHHAKDAELMRIFAEHRATFDRLVSMSDSDSVFVRITPRFTQPDIPTGRWNAYRAAFDTLHLARGLTVTRGAIPCV
jgi:hypothetical protein